MWKRCGETTFVGSKKEAWRRGGGVFIYYLV